jgi:Terminase large subunit, T4likevirus-type, N-terminal
MVPRIMHTPRKTHQRASPGRGNGVGLNILSAMDDPNVFGQHFHRNPKSWLAWRSFLCALFGLSMSPDQLAIYRRCTNRTEPPTDATNEAWLVIGRRGGKSFVLALIAVFLASFRDYRDYLGPGERGTIVIIAQDRKSARTILRYVLGLLRAVHMLARTIQHEGKESVDLTNRLTIEIHTANFRTVRGYTIVAALCDELAFWRTEDDSANPDVQILQALRPAMATIPNAMLLCASSPYAQAGALFDAYKKYHGTEHQVLCWQADTRTMNPTVPQSYIDAETEKDPAAAQAEYGAQFRLDIESFISREAVEACVAPVHELAPASGINYFAGIDPSGGSSDSMTLAISHKDKNNRVILDCIRERRPPFSPVSVVTEFAGVLETYGIRKVIGDHWGGEFVREPFRLQGIQYELAEQPKSDYYRDLLPLINSGNLQLINHPRLISQLCNLERRTARSGKDSIDHVKGGHDDIANAAALAIVSASNKRRGLAGLFTSTVMQRVSNPQYANSMLRREPRTLAHLRGGLGR